MSVSARESIPFSLALDQGDGLLKWSATPTFSFLRLTAQIGLPQLCYSYVELTEARIEPRTFRLQGERSTD